MEQHKSNRGFKSFVIIACILLLLIFLCCITLLTKKGTDNPVNVFQPDPNAKIGALFNGDRDKMNQEANDRGLVTFVINSTPYFESGSSTGNINIENPPENTNRLTCEIKLDETNESLYKSGYLDPGQYIDNVDLKRTLPDGIYETTAYFNAFEIETNKYIGNVAAEVTLYIGNMG